jgi:hypothetical protein
MTDECLIEIALGNPATKEESEEMAMRLLNWSIGPKDENEEGVDDNMYKSANKGN